MQRAVGASALLLCLGIGFGNVASAQDAMPRERRATRTAAAPSSTALLAAEIREIANSSSLSIARKEKRIATAVRVAVVSATAYKSDAGQNLENALELAGAAAQAAPRFTEVIVNAVSFSPAISRIDGSAGQIRAATFAAAKAASGKKTRQPAATAMRQDGSKAAQRRATPRPMVKDVPYPDFNNAPTSSAQPRPRPAETEAKSASLPSDNDGPDFVRTPSRGAIEHAGEYAGNTPMDATNHEVSASPLAGNFAFHAKADITFRHDDNVYLSKENKTSDQIISLTPGVDFSFGQNSLTHGTLGYQVEFLRYVNHTAPSARLNHVIADFGYSSASFSLSASGSYNQAYQNNRDVLVEGNSALIRSNSLNLGASGEGSITPKMSIKTGASYAQIEYPDPATPPPPAQARSALTGNKIFSVPLNIYYNITPKTDLSVGVTYSSIKPDSDGPGGHDLYYNVGMRGQFTAKLTGEFSVGYRKRHGDNGTDDSSVGYNGTFNYELTPKTSTTLQLGRDFSTSATGESLQNASYGLKLSTVFTPQWEAGISLLYRQIDYGRQFFGPAATTPPDRRKDNYWEGSLSASYIFSSWLTTTAGYTLRNNSSADNPGVEFSNSLLSIMVGLRY